MYAATLSEIRRELKERSLEEIVEFCLKMAKYKKDNKELLNYLLFEANDEVSYIEDIKQVIADEFIQINIDSVYYVKKSIRRILRFVNKHVRYSGIKQTEVELLIYFCQQFRKLPIPFHQSRVLINLYNRQLEIIQKALKQLDEDLRFDYQAEIEEITKTLSQV